MPANRLIGEKSPYLLQHAHNPVDWYPWGDQAFAKAASEDKPIFLSIGYSTCHWCHVMERESFENEEIAAILNRDFVPVKVDREERPDIDRIYMMFVQATTGGGGWPMSVWLTPDRKPFYGGTYFPPDNRWGRPGFRYLLERLAEAWRTERRKIVESGAEVLEKLAELSASTTVRGSLHPGILDSGFYAFRRMFDARLGGFGGAPKFPRPSIHNFLLREAARNRNEEAASMVLETLTHMAKGGVNDQIGGGFHRYAVDERWFVPHFEKMLYDQAQLVISFAEAFQYTRNPYYAQRTREICEYVLRDLTSELGAFYSAEDADSVIDPALPQQKGEGAFYVWTRREVDDHLGAPLANWFAYRYGILPQGNVENDPQGEFTGKNILYEAKSVAETAAHFHTPETAMEQALREAAQKLLAVRNQRIRPHRDDKILTSWNGLMISAFSIAAQALGEARYAHAAQRAADFILAHLYRPHAGDLLRRFRDGEAAIDGLLDDYAFLAQACLDLYETVFDINYLAMAMELTDEMRRRFEDLHNGSFFSTRADSGDLVLRLKDDYDGAEPSGNSVAAINLLRLAHFTGRPDYEDAARRTLEAFAARLTQTPAGLPQMLVAYGYGLAKPRQIVIVGERHAADTRALLEVLRSLFLPDRVVMLLDGEQARNFFAQFQPAFSTMEMLDGKATAYVCENFACRLPVNSPEALRELLK